MSKSAKRLTRRQRIAAEQDVRFVQQAAAVAEYTEPKPSGVAKLIPKNKNQQIALDYLNADTPITILCGSAGTGKSMLAAYRAATLLKSKKIDKVFLVRPSVSTGKSNGAVPGSITEKLTPYFLQTLSHLEKFLGKGYLNYCLQKEKIEMRAIEYMRGTSFESCFVIVEESQDLTASEFEMVLTRLGDACSICFTGDEKQHDLRGVSGLETTLKLLDRVMTEQPSYMGDDELDDMDSGIGIVRFLPSDVVRSGLTKAFVNMYYHN